jgi:SSS family solute:Na+ symporter
MIAGLSATMSSGDSDAISGVTILLTDVYPSVTGKTIKEEDYQKYSRIALVTTLAIAFFITLFVNDVITYIQTVVGALLPGVAVAMLMGRFWKRANWQGGLACIGSGTILGVLILVIPAFKTWINSVFGGPAVAATLVSLVFGIVVSLIFPADDTPDEVRLQNVYNDRRGTVVEKVANKK